MPSEPSFILHDHGDVHAVRFGGHLFDAARVDAAKHEIRALVDEAERPKLVLNLADVKFASSVFLGAVMELAIKVRRKGGELRLCCMSPQIRSMFELMKI